MMDPQKPQGYTPDTDIGSIALHKSLNPATVDCPLPTVSWQLPADLPLARLVLRRFGQVLQLIGIAVGRNQIPVPIFIRNSMP